MLLFRLKEVKRKEEVRKQEIKKGKMTAGGLVSANQRLCIHFVSLLRFKYSSLKKLPETYTIGESMAYKSDHSF